MIRLKDIAERAGVSIMTVSKVLRDAPDISVATKTKIRQMAQQMGYVPDSMAQTLRTRTSKLLGLVISSTANPIFPRTIMGLEERAFELGYDLLLAHTLNLPEREETVIRRLLARRVDGLFVAPVYRLSPAAPIYEELARRQTPTVLLGHRAAFCQNFPSVETNDALATSQAVQHLIQLGHRRIALFAGPQAAPWAQQRSEGYRRALRDSGCQVDDALIFNAGATIEDGEKAALQMLGESTQATAVQAANDLVAIGAANVFLAKGLRIPEDISIVGFGNIMASEFYRVPLTTVREPQYRLGTSSMELMQKLIRHEPVLSEHLPADLIFRSSTAPPPP